MPSTKVISPLGYIAVLVALVVLTIATVGFSFMDVSGGWHVAVGLAIAVAKAALVALFFMHLIHSRRTNWAVVAVSLFWLAIVLCTLTFSDYASRGFFPHVPGH